MAELVRDARYEANPYRGDLPYELAQLSDSLYRFLQELIQILREQHNITHGGDATYQWELLTEYNDAAVFHVGSIGRFLHPTYGVILARYVQFTVDTDEPVDSEGLSVVAGFQRTRKEFQWAATTRYDYSSADDAIGLIGGYGQPVRGQYGWVIISGVNLRSVRFVGVEAPQIGTRLTWRDSVSTEASEFGTIIGVVTSTLGLEQVLGGIWDIAPACIRVDIAHQQREADASTVQPVVTPEQLDQIADAVAGLLDLATVTQQIIALQQAVAKAAQDLGVEQSIRQNGDDNHDRKITELTGQLAATGVELDDLTATVAANKTLIQNALTAAVAQINLDIAALGDRVNAVQDVNATQDGAISGLTAQAAALAARVTALEGFNLDSRLTTAEAAIVTLDGRLDAYDAQNLDSRLGVVEAAATSLDGRLDTLEGQNLDSRLTTAEGNITALDGRLDTYDSQNLDTRLTSAEAALLDIGTPVGVTYTGVDWDDAGTPYATVTYQKTHQGIVILQGAMAGGAMAVDGVVFTLPAGFRPAATHMFTARCDGGTFEIMIESTGDVTVSGAATTWSDFGFIQFIAA